MIHIVKGTNLTSNTLPIKLTYSSICQRLFQRLNTFAQINRFWKWHH